MTGRELIVYILEHKLEDEPVYKNGKIIGFVTVPEAAAKMNVGMSTIYTWIAQDQIDYILIGGTYLIYEKCELKRV